MASTLNTVNIPITNTTASGAFLTTAGSNGVTWATAPINQYDAILTVPANSNTLEVKGNLVINGVDLEERLKTIESILQIPERDVILEKNYPKLKKMYNEYIKELSKARMWESLKGEEG